MTNEEKAKEIAEETLGDFSTSFLGWIDECSEMFCTESAARMAEWKDQQFKEYLERKKKKLNEGVKNFLEKGKADTALLYQTQITLLNEIINEFFKEN